MGVTVAVYVAVQVGVLVGVNVGVQVRVSVGVNVGVLVTVAVLYGPLSRRNGKSSDWSALMAVQTVPFVELSAYAFVPS